MWILYHEVHLLSLLFSVIIFVYFFVTIKDTLVVRFLSAGLFVFAASLLCEIPWMLGYSIYTGAVWPVLDCIEFSLGEIFIIYMVDYLRRRGLKLPRVDLKRWLVVFCIVLVLTAILYVHGFYPLWWVYLSERTSVNPHLVYPFNLDWSIAKAVGVLGWMLIARSDVNV